MPQARDGSMFRDHRGRDELHIPGANRLLSMVSEDALERLFPHMERVVMDAGEVVEWRCKRRDYAYFPLSCVVCVFVRMADGSRVEAVTVGNEGVVGIPALTCTGGRMLDVLASVGGEAVRVPLELLEEEFRSNDVFAGVMHRYGQSHLTQITQVAACNSLHTVDQRLCRWILMVHDRLGTDRLPVTHEGLAGVLGVRRATVSTAAAALQRSGAIRYRRGILDIVDRPALEATACECYGVVRSEMQRLLCH